jgi:hypothetical protein
MSAIAGGRTVGRVPPGSKPELQKERVAPRVAELRDPLPPSDDTEAGSLVQREARHVLGKDARLDRPEPSGVGTFDECLHERQPDPSTPRALGDVNGVLDDARVARARGRGLQRRPTDDCAVLDRDEALVSEPAVIELLPGRGSVSKVASPVRIPSR